MILNIAILVLFWLIASASLQILANYYRARLFSKAITFVLAAIILPIALPVSFNYLLTLIQKLTPPEAGLPNAALFSNLATGLTASCFEFIIVALYIRFSGGVWHHSTKSGAPDRRYKYNQFYPYYDEDTKTVSQFALTIPVLVSVLLIARYFILQYLSKHS